MCTVRRSDFPCTHHRRHVLCTLVPEFAARIGFVARRVRVACVGVWRVACGVRRGAVVLHSVLAASPQRYVRARKRRHTHVPRRSTIVRLRSGASVSRAGAFRIGPFRCGGDAARVGTFAFSRPLRSSLRAVPWGHFASLVRSIAAQSARLPSESFAFFGAFLRAISPCVSILYDAAARRLHLPCRPASMRIRCGIKALVLAGEGEDFIRTVIA